MLHREWIHMCWLNNGTTSKAYVNGKISLEYLSASPFKNIKMDKSSNYSMIFGQEADSFKGSFNPEQSFRGKISEFHIWNYTLSANIINEMFNCKSALKGNIVSWDTEYIIFHSVRPEHANIERLCAPYDKVIFINDSMNYNDAENYCKIHNGYLYTPESKLRNDWMVGMTLKFNKTCEEDPWINRSPNLESAGSDKQFNNWERNLIEDYCSTIRPDGKWLTQTNHICDYQIKCFACAFVHEPVFTVKGFCLDFIPSYNYYINHGENGMQYIGYKDSSIIRSPHGWKLLDKKGTEIISTTKDTKTPLGRMSWFGTYEDCKLIKEHILITISSCNMHHQFTCSSGQCIDIEMYCDNHVDCKDGSDEDDCTHIVTNPGYSKIDPPDLENMNNSMFINIKIIQFDNIDSLKMTMTLTMDVQISWKDPRLVFKGLSRYQGPGMLRTNMHGNYLNKLIKKRPLRCQLIIFFTPHFVIYLYTLLVCLSVCLYLNVKTAEPNRPKFCV